MSTGNPDQKVCVYSVLSSLKIDCPKHLLGQNFPSKGKLGGISLRGKIFPLRDNFPLKIAFPFPWKALFSQEMKGLGERNFYSLSENF